MISEYGALNFLTQPGFLCPLRSELVEPGWWRSKYKLTSPLMYVTWEVAEPPVLIYIPKGFKTDYASVPRVPVAYWLVGRIGDPAAVVHDYLYWKQNYSKSLCDRIYLEALLACNVHISLASIMYTGVVVGGHRAYNRHARRVSK